MSEPDRNRPRQPDRPDLAEMSNCGEMPDLGEMSVKTAIRKAMPLTGRRIGDLGSGNGALTAWLRREGALALGVDPHAALLTTASERHGGDWLAAAAERLPLASASLDAAIFFNSLHHVAPARQVAALAEAARALAPGGDLLVIEPAASGSYFALLRPLDDETAVRAAAQRALKAVAGRLLERVARGRFTTFLEVEGPAAVVAAFTRADPARAELAATALPAIERQFVAQGEAMADGRRRFCQPMLLQHLRLAQKAAR